MLGRWNVAMNDPITDCEAFAKTNHGVIPRTVALAMGVDDAALHRLLKKDRWRRIFARAYAVAGAPETWQMQLAAVAAGLNAPFAFSHRTAGALHGLDGVDEGAVEFVATTTPRLQGVRAHRVKHLPTVHHQDGFPVTTPQRTILDLFSVVSPGTAERALEDALRKRLTSIDRLWSEYTTQCRRGRNGCSSFRDAMLRHDDRDGTLQSRMEAKLRGILKSLPGPAAIPQHPVGSYRLDFAYRDIKLGIEAQSIRWHLGRAKFAYDMKRDRALKRQGWTLAYFTWDDLLRPKLVADEVAALRASLSPVLL